MKEPLKPLIPLDQLKQVVKGLIAVPKDKMDEAEAKKPKSSQRKSKP